MYQNENCFSIKQYILTTSCLDILIDCAFFSNKQHHPISLKYSLWPGYLGNRAMWKKEVFSIREFSYFEICLPTEASPIYKKKQSLDILSVSEVTYRLFNSPEITNEISIRFRFFGRLLRRRERNWKENTLCFKKTLLVINFSFRKWDNSDTSCLVMVLPASSTWQLI